MKKALIFTIVILSCIQINAQTLTGMVYDKDTKQPILGVYVYLDGTSIVDVTDNSGKFTLAVKQMINTKLVLRHLGYHTLIIEEPFNNLPDTIYMEEQFTMLGEVFVQADQFSRRQRLRAFREQFLGQTQAGNSCRIVNEGDIQIWFNVATKTLRASSDKPIEVINEYLGYRIFFTLVDFWVEYSSVTLNSNRMQRFYFEVTTLFADLRPDDARIKRRRDDVYEESTRNFFKKFAYDPFFSSDISDNPLFWVYENGAQIDFNLYFTIKDTLSQKIIYLSDAISEKENPDNSLLIINVSHRDPHNRYLRYYSDISFFTPNLLVDQYGNIDQIDKVVFTGLMSLKRAGDMLPLDYEP